MDSAELRIVPADLANPVDAAAVVALVDAYACDPMADGVPLPDDVKRALVPQLRAHPTTIVYLAWLGAEAVGVAVAFLGFSTFKARPLINLHDLGVLPQHRGRGIGTRLIAALEAHARSLGCCKLTLEVLANNHRARAVYEKVGFREAAYAPEAGTPRMLWKPL